MGLLEEAESVSHDVLKNIKIRLLSLWGDVGQLEGTDRGTKLIKGEYYCWDGSNIPTVEQAKSGAGMCCLSVCWHNMPTHSCFCYRGRKKTFPAASVIFVSRVGYNSLQTIKGMYNSIMISSVGTS